MLSLRGLTFAFGTVKQIGLVEQGGLLQEQKLLLKQ